MTEGEVVDVLRAAVVWAQPEAAAAAPGIDLDTAFSDLGMESIALLEMAAFVEDRLGLQFPDERMMSVVTVRHFVEMVRDSVAGRAS